MNRFATLFLATCALAVPLGCRPGGDAKGLATGLPVRPDRIVVIPLGHVRDEDVATAANALENSLKLTVVVGAPTALPRSAFYAPRGRYRADALIGFLKTLGYPAGTKIVGVTRKDISTTARGQYDWGVFGLGGLGGSACVVSTFRLSGPGAKSEAERLADVVVHEVGHTLGLPHCPTPRCIMSDAGGSIETVDTSTGEFCDLCRRKLGGLAR